jgi:hypothetical protein
MFSLVRLAREVEHSLCALQTLLGVYIAFLQTNKIKYGSNVEDATLMIFCFDMIGYFVG